MTHCKLPQLHISDHFVLINQSLHRWQHIHFYFCTCYFVCLAVSLGWQSSASNLWAHSWQMLHLGISLSPSTADSLFKYTSVILFSPLQCLDVKLEKFPLLSLKMSSTGNETHKSLCMSGTNVPTVSHQLEFFTTWRESGRPIDTFQPGSHC